MTISLAAQGAEFICGSLKIVCVAAELQIASSDFFDRELIVF